MSKPRKAIASPALNSSFAEHFRAHVEVVATVNNRRQLEKLLNEASGRDWTVKFMAKEGILSSTAAEGIKSAEPFKDDPLIQQAIELFKAEVRR